MVVEQLDRMRKEWSVIKGAPFSFMVVCVLAAGALWSSFHYVYSEKLTDAQRDVTKWQGNSAYWKEQAEKPKPAPNCTQVSTPNTSEPPPKSSSRKPKEVPTIQQDCGGGNCAASTGQQGGITAGQINIAPPDRHISQAQRDAIADAVRGKQCKIDSLHSLANAPDSQNFALEIASAFAAGGCTVPKEAYLAISPNGAWRGIQLVYHSNTDSSDHRPGEMILVAKDTPEGVICSGVLRSQNRDKCQS